MGMGEKGQGRSPAPGRRKVPYPNGSEPRRTEPSPVDRIRITRNEASLDLVNGGRFTVARVSREAVTIESSTRRVELPADRPLHLDYSYATTIHSSQGTTADRVLIDALTRSWTTARDACHVAICRARYEVRVYTDDAARPPRAIERAARSMQRSSSRAAEAG